MNQLNCTTMVAACEVVTANSVHFVYHTPMKQDERIDHPFGPTFNKNSRVLILGSFPSVKTRAQAFPYGHPQNRFWPIISRILEVDPPLLATEPERTRRILLEGKIAIWDSIASCRITGSSDSSIKDATPTDLGRIFEEADIKMVFCNGATSYRYYQRWQYKQFGREAILLPSTSPANAAWSMDRLYDTWKQIKDYLG